MLQLVIDSGILPSLVNLLGHHEVNVVVSVLSIQSAYNYKLLFCEQRPLVNDLPKFSQSDNATVITYRGENSKFSFV